MLGPPRSPARPLVSSVSRSLLRARRFVRGHRPFPPVSVHSGPQSFKHTPTDWCPRRFTPRSQCSRAPRPFARPPDRPAVWSSIPPGPCLVVHSARPMLRATDTRPPPARARLGPARGRPLTLLSALMRRGCTLMLSLTTDTAVLGVMVAALLGAVEMMA